MPITDYGFYFKMRGRKLIEKENMVDRIREKINNLIEEFTQYPNKYLTEEDVRCNLVIRLAEIPGLNDLQDTRDNSKSTPIHTEVRWYGSTGKLKWRSDIVIINVETLVVKNKPFHLPSKGYGFLQPLAIIEIKLRRTNGQGNNAFMEEIKKDIHKLKEIKNEVEGSYPCFLIILDKKAKIDYATPRVDNGISRLFSQKCGK